ncbi:MAG: hypothetical protein ACR2K3_06050 [Nocardioides sp.]
MSADLGEMPDPVIEPGEPNPGGVDAIEGNDHETVAPLVPDLSPDDNPAVDDEAPDEIKQPDDTDTEATSDGASEPQKESPA